MTESEKDITVEELEETVSDSHWYLSYELMDTNAGVEK